MRYEYSHEHTHEVFEVQAPAPIPDVIRIEQPVPQAAPAVNRGCVTTTTFALVILSSLSFLSFCGAISLGLPLAALVNLIEAVLYTAVVIGLRSHARWAANLMIFIVILLAAGFVVSPAILLIESMRLYVTSTAARIMLSGVSAVMAGVAFVFLSFVAWWYWDKRRLFLPSPVVDAWGGRLYWVVALLIFAIIFADGWTTYQSRADQLEPQVNSLRQFNRMMEESW
ncbi:MAG: hypothetical protein H6673_03280 [Anaerolineales bacterium]|nr:hypothetical protein [Anaerolineales bacterium]